MKQAFLDSYRAALLANYPWACNTGKLDHFMTSVERTLRTEAKTWNHDGPSVLKAYRAVGGKGRATLTALRSMPE